MSLAFTFHFPVAWMESIGILPHNRDDPERVQAHIKNALEHALSKPVPNTAAAQVEVNDGAAGKMRLTVSVTDSIAMPLKAYAKEMNLGIGPAAKSILGLIYQGLIDAPSRQTREPEVSANHPLTILNRARSREPRMEQVLFYNNVWAALDGKQVGLVEAGTGIGKTLAILAAARRWVALNNSSCLIAGPTLSILRQFKSEYYEQSKVTEDMPDLRVIVGKREFVSKIALVEFLDNRGKQWDSPEIREWMVRGLPAVIPEDDEDTSWQVKWLEELAPGFPVSEVILDEVTLAIDPGMQAYRAQFAKILKFNEKGEPVPMPPAILLCTHAMLANDMRKKMKIARGNDEYAALLKDKSLALKAAKDKKDQNNPKYKDEVDKVKSLDEQIAEKGKELLGGDIGILPFYQSVIVDEGHQLEENFSNSLADSVSLTRLLSNLWKFQQLGGKISVECIQKVKSHIDSLIASGKQYDGQDYISLGQVRVDMLSALAEIAAVTQKLPNVRDTTSEKFSLGDNIKKEGKLIARACGDGINAAYLRFSPVRKFPQICIGQRSVSDVLSALWNSCTSACVVSATLYLQNSDGPNANYSSILLSIPDARRMTAAPIRSSWSTDPVRDVYVADQVGRWLYPPNMNEAKESAKGLAPNQDKEEAIRNAYKVQEDRWHGEVSTEVLRIWQSAKGGALVLCTSYATVDAIADLVKQKQPEIALVLASPEFALAKQSKQFLNETSNGKRPLWLAVGGAWTGLDVGGHDPWKVLFGEPLKPTDDNVFTDLVIPRMPFKTNRSLTHAWRCINRPDMPWDILDAAFRFKQALGRLVRREGLSSNRRIFILDARLKDPRQMGRFAPFERCLSIYGKSKIWSRESQT